MALRKGLFHDFHSSGNHPKGSIDKLLCFEKPHSKRVIIPQGIDERCMQRLNFVGQTSRLEVKDEGFGSVTSNHEVVTEAQYGDTPSLIRINQV